MVIAGGGGGGGAQGEKLDKSDFSQRMELDMLYETTTPNATGPPQHNTLASLLTLSQERR